MTELHPFCLKSLHLHPVCANQKHDIVTLFFLNFTGNGWFNLVKKENKNSSTPVFMLRTSVMSGLVWCYLTLPFLHKYLNYIFKELQYIYPRTTRNYLNLTESFHLPSRKPLHIHQGSWTAGGGFWSQSPAEQCVGCPSCILCIGTA